MLSEKLLARLAEEGDAPDYQRLAADVLGIHGAPAALARTLVEQALVVTDWRERWRQTGARAVLHAPPAPGVYIFRDEAAVALYVGKAANLRRRLSAHFAESRWRALPPALARVATVECERLGSELEALLRESALVRDLRPVVNVQTAAPSLATRAIARSLVRDVVLLLPSVAPEGVVIVAARVDGATLVLQASRTGTRASVPADRLWAFFAPSDPQPAHGTSAGAPEDNSAPLVFSWLAGRGQRTTRLDPHDFSSADDLRLRLDQLLATTDLFVDRIVPL